MSKPILRYPAGVLRGRAAEADPADPGLKDIVATMIETMYANDGVGLAAPQIGVGLRIIALDTSHERNEARVYLNPRIVARSGKADDEEGCLSVPGIKGRVDRAERITVKALTLEGEEVEIEAEGFEARVFQHEIDHVDGMLFIGRLRPAKRRAIADELEALEKKDEGEE